MRSAAGAPRTGPWAAAIGSLAALSNVTCKLSGVHTSPARASDLRPYYETVLTAFGPDRLMFGSDWPVATLGAAYAQVCDVYRELTAQLSPAEQDAIFDGTARRVHQLPGPRPEVPSLALQRSRTHHTGA
jgi:L-fuconolactonase